MQINVIKISKMKFTFMRCNNHCCNKVSIVSHKKTNHFREKVTLNVMLR
jgi:hypothetical protein